MERGRTYGGAKINREMGESGKNASPETTVSQQRPTIIAAAADAAVIGAIFSGAAAPVKLNKNFHS